MVLLNYLVLLFISFAGFDVITLANNHMNDFGSNGATFTAQVLKKAGIKYFGITYGKFDSSQVSLSTYRQLQIKLMDHFRVAVNLIMKARLSTKFLL